jgi:hypothetical protein
MSTYTIWKRMRQRCSNPNSSNYEWYGGRGIKVCERWDSFANFLSDMGERPDGLSIDRRDNDGDYCPENCRWATTKQQHRNKSSNRLITHNSQTRCLIEWSEFAGLSIRVLAERLRTGWDFATAITTPVRRYGDI